jgi:hypothetical protein
MSTADDELMARLSAVARTADPAPPLTHEMAKAAFGLRTLDAELAELVADSLESAGAVRGPSDVRLLAFEAGDVSVDVEVAVDGEHRRLVGQLSGGVDLEVDTAAGSRAAEVDDLGRFVVAALPAGPIRLRTTTADGRSVVTAWTTI